MKHAGTWLTQAVIGLIVFIVIITVLQAAIQPYLPFIGKVLALLILAPAIIGIGILTKYAIERYKNGSDDDDDTLNLGGWD